MLVRQSVLKCKQLIFSGFALFTLLFSSNVLQAQDLDAGKALFRANCKQCHNPSMKDDMTGPALAGVEERWGDTDDLYAWIRNSVAFAETGNAYAQTMIDWAPSAMNAFPTLTDDDLSNLLGYIDGVSLGVYPPKIVDAGGAVAVVDKPTSNWVYAGLVGLLGLIAFILARVASNYNRLLEYKENGIITEQPTIWESLTKKSVISFLIFVGIVVLGFTTVNQTISYGRQQGYQPDQPIAFSHEIHAGINKIDCQYCHDGARRSKHAVIPAANTCMNCHKAIEKGSTYGTAELTKIFASIGYDPSTDQYIENYESLKEDDIKAIYTKWISNEYIKDNDLSALDSEGEELVAYQWNGIKTSLTNDDKPQIQGPIEWIKIHNLPDHVYFNHSQHVTIGEVACQECHGEVEGMGVVQQYSTLSMAWCISCHKQTEVQFKGNEYYNSYQKYHDELNSGVRKKVTVEDIGGVECQKCHY